MYPWPWPCWPWQWPSLRHTTCASGWMGCLTPGMSECPGHEDSVWRLGTFVFGQILKQWHVNHQKMISPENFTGGFSHAMFDYQMVQTNINIGMLNNQQTCRNWSRKENLVEKNWSLMRNMGGYLIQNPWWLSRLVRNLREQLGIALNSIPFEGVEQECRQMR